MNPKLRSTEIPKRPAPLALPLKIGYSDGSNAHIVTDINDNPIGSPYSVIPGLTVEEARKHPVVGPQLIVVEYMLNAINSYESLVGALQMIHAVAPNKTTHEFAAKALKAAGELKE